MAASLSSARVIVVCQTIVVRPRWSGMQTAWAVSPSGTARKKFVLLSIVVVRAPSARLSTLAAPPRISAKAMMAPPCMTPLRLASSSPTVSSAAIRSREPLVKRTPINREDAEFFFDDHPLPAGLRFTVHGGNPLLFGGGGRFVHSATVWRTYPEISGGEHARAGSSGPVERRSARASLRPRPRRDSALAPSSLGSPTRQ